MNYYQLKSILTSKKKKHLLKNPSTSFYIASSEKRPYIAPDFEKIIYDTEKPSIILISAVGATGKSALANTLSVETSLPILDLGKHKPVGDNTLSGLLTNAYDFSDISDVFKGISNGNYGIIIDGLDEGRSKTTEKGFEAFLDDIVNLCGNSERTTLVMLGRTQVIEDCWLYLDENNVKVCLIAISSFTINSAKEYIDTFTMAASSPHIENYKNTRDVILEKLGDAFSPDTKAKTESFNTFIGYPPVLDAIVTLLSEEINYHKLMETISGDNNVEINLLYKIVIFLIEREREDKVLPHIVRPLISDFDEEVRERLEKTPFLFEEQSARLVAHCIGETVEFETFAEPFINEKYESQLVSWLHEHPFLNGNQFRNAVFEAAVLSKLMISPNEKLHKLVRKYMRQHKPSYHLIYMADSISSSTQIPFQLLNTIVASAMEFHTVHSAVDIHIKGENWREQESDTRSNLSIEIELELGKEEKKRKIFTFDSSISEENVLLLGPRISSTFISIPCSVELRSRQDLEFTAPVEIEARNINLNADSVVVRSSSATSNNQEVLLSSHSLESTVEKITPTAGVHFSITLEDNRGVNFPATKYIELMEPLPNDPMLTQKYLIFRRILMEFRSHSKGSLAKYKDKIHNERVLKNDLGRELLQQMLKDGVFYSKGRLYHINPDQLHSHVGISWQALRKGKTTEPLKQYLEKIRV